MKYLVTSLGRCGSTMLYNTLVAHNLPMADNKGVSNHLYPNDIIKKYDSTKIKVIFLIGDPIDIILSIKQREKDISIEWIQAHFYNMKSNFMEYPNIYNKDVLHLAHMLEMYMKPCPFPLLIINFRDLWKCESIISKFCGVNIKLPSYSPLQNCNGGSTMRSDRLNNLTEEEKQQLQNTYGPLAEKIRHIAFILQNSSKKIK